MDSNRVEKDDLKPIGFDWRRLLSATPAEIGVRFLFGGGIALVAALVGSTLGPKAGGLFLAFPAVLPATLTLIEKKEGLSKAWADASGGVLGAVGLGAFAGTAVLLLRWNPVLALIAGLVAWTLVSVGLYVAFRSTGLFLKQDELLSKSG
jgi:Protein of unknown function (DUF3147)